MISLRSFHFDNDENYIYSIYKYEVASYSICTLCKHTKSNSTNKSLEPLMNWIHIRRRWCPCCAQHHHICKTWGHTKQQAISFNVLLFFFFHLCFCFCFSFGRINKRMSEMTCITHWSADHTYYFILFLIQ